MYLGIEIGGTKLQLAVGPGDGSPFVDFQRAEIRLEEGAGGILRQIESVGRELIERHQPRAIGIGFGGPVDAEAGRTITSHQVEGWTDFALADWCRETFGLPAGLSNDSDAAGLAEALFGAGRGHRVVFYINVGSGIGGALVVDGRVYSGGHGIASEIGHLRPGLDADDPHATVESICQRFRHRRGRAVLAGRGELPRSVRRRSAGPVRRPDRAAQRPDGRRSGRGRQRGGSGGSSPGPCKRSAGPLPR